MSDPGAHWTERVTRDPRVVAPLLLLLAAAVAGASALQLHQIWEAEGRSVPYLQIYRRELVEWTVWALAIPLVAAVDRRAGFGTGRVPRAVLLHLTLFLVFFSLQNGVMTWVSGGFDPVYGDAAAWERFRQRFSVKAPGAALGYLIILGGIGALRFHGAYLRRMASEARLESRLQEARLSRLRAQLRPHFLFNSLHLIANLMEEGERSRAVESVRALSGLLRRSLAADAHPTVPLEEELDLVRAYVALQRYRFEDRLEVEWEVAPEALRVPVPGFSLQPLVENAIRHGLQLEDGPGRVRIRAGREGDRLSLVVEDNGRGPGHAATDAGDSDDAYLPGPPPGGLPDGRPDDDAGRRPGTGTGIGLANLRARIQELYGDRGRVQVERGEAGGARVRVEVPWEEEPLAESALYDPPEATQSSSSPGAGATMSDQFKVTLRDRSIEMYRADRMVDAHGRVRLLDGEGEEVAAWDEDEVRAVQKVDDPREEGGY